MIALPIPEPALENHVAVLGKTGSGKSNLAKLIATWCLKKKRRTCIIDPTGTWWGLRLTAEGKPSPFPIVIFGGEHGDIAISDAHGAAIAETIGTTSTPAIVDTRLMTVGARTRFFTDFAENLLRTNKGPLTLIVDEAHLFAPQGRVNDPRSGAMVHAANNLVSLGRGIGLSIVLISQRPAKLHKDSLTQAETLVAMRLIHNLDVDAVRTWIGECADPAEGRELVGSLPRLKVGEAWVWAPALDYLKQITAPLVDTFDSGKPLAGRKVPVLGAIDVGQVTAKLETVGKDVLAKDPARLQARIAELARENATLKSASIDAQIQAAPDPVALDDAYQRGVSFGHESGFALGAHEAFAFAGTHMANAFDYARQAAEAVQNALAADRDLARSGKWAAEFSSRDRPVAKATSVNGIPEKRVSGQLQRRNPPPREVDLKVNTETDRVDFTDVDLTPAKRRILKALRRAEALGRPEPTRQVVAFFAGASWKSGGFRNNLSSLSSGGLISYPGQGTVALTTKGQSAEPPIDAPTHEELMALAQSLFTPAQMRILQAVVEAWPGEISREALANRVGASSISGGFRNNLSRLSASGLITYPAPSVAQASEVLFP